MLNKSKKIENPTTPVVKDGIEYHCGWVYTQRTLDIVMGNQLAIIEAVGLPEKQEEAIKSQIRQSLFRPQRLARFLTAREISEMSNEKAEPLSDLLISDDVIRNVK